jgi:hypothetical protein
MSLLTKFWILAELIARGGIAVAPLLCSHGPVL